MTDTAQLARLKEEIARYAIRSYQRGLVGGSGGNVSARIPGTDEILITRTGVILGEVTPDDVVGIDAWDGRSTRMLRSRPRKFPSTPWCTACAAT